MCLENDYRQIHTKKNTTQMCNLIKYAKQKQDRKKHTTKIKINGKIKNYAYEARYPHLQTSQ